MALIPKGAGIDVFYYAFSKKQQKQVLKVHTGRLLWAQYGGQRVDYVDPQRRPQAVAILHWNYDRDLGIMFLEQRTLRKIYTVKRVPDLKKSDPRYCPTTPVANGVTPHTMFGVMFTRNNGKIDVKNGRYLFWRASPNGKVRCPLRKNSKPFSISFYHWIIKQQPSGGNPPVLKAVIKTVAGPIQWEPTPGNLP